MCETKFLQMCSFSIILTSLHPLKLLFLLLFYVIYTAISTLIPCIAILISHIFRISTQICGIPTPIPWRK